MIALEMTSSHTLDQEDPLKDSVSRFHRTKDVYLAGHSLGLMPKGVEEIIGQELKDWSRLGVDGHFEAKRAWLPYHENVTASLANLVGAKEDEVVAMNSLTVNLHLMLVSFYRPTNERYKILIEGTTFPSDKYAVDSQARFHGFDAEEAVVQLPCDENNYTTSFEKVLETIDTHKDSLALIMLGNANYLSGQVFPFEATTKAAHAHNIPVGFNLAHGAGNVELKLHDWNVDFAVWCSYKYLNAGPGGIAASFVHQNHLGKKDTPRFEGWWGHDKKTRFQMGPEFSPIPTVEAWQLSNPPIFQLAALRASLDEFDKAGVSALHTKRKKLNKYFREQLNTHCSEFLNVVTPENSAAMLCTEVKGGTKNFYEKLKAKGVVGDYREPNILRMSLPPLYSKYADAEEAAKKIKEAYDDHS